ncbi:MAG: serine/threonine protein kinase, partial [bacterium]|nr:serine/threonine protein kinase [bacterium]
GGNLRQWLKQGKCRDYRLNLNLALQFCHGMEYAHGKGMIHRDIKPENILLTQDGTLKITDFGLVRKTTDPREKITFIQDPHPSANVNKSQDETLTQWGTFMGTEGYISPEQAASAGEVDQRTDIFAFGICLYEMFCHGKPYDITYGPKQEAPDPVTLSNDENFPPPLAEILKKCIQWDREQRWFDFNQVRRQLAGLYRELFGEDSP